MKTHGRHAILAAALAIAATSCSDDGGDAGTTYSTTSKKCVGTTGTEYSEGSYRCNGTYGIQICRSGAWQSAGSCTCKVYDGDPRKPPYASTCKGDARGNVTCSYAFKSCMTCTKGDGCE